MNVIFRPETYICQRSSYTKHWYSWNKNRCSHSGTPAIQAGASASQPPKVRVVIKQFLYENDKGRDDRSLSQ